MRPERERPCRGRRTGCVRVGLAAPPLYWLRVCETLLVRLGPLRMEGVEVG